MVTVVLPAFNEVAGIGEFLEEIDRAFGQESVTFIVVDDASTDGMFQHLQELVSRSALNLFVFRNSQNQGHGPTLVTGLLKALEQEKDETILSVDGDGQFFGVDLVQVVRQLHSNDLDVVEGLRVKSSTPFYRRVSSFATRVLVWAHCGSYPKDANTPVRAYRRASLAQLMEFIPEGSLVPNIRMSALARDHGLRIGECCVTVRPRLGEDETGSTWGRSPRFLPSARFVAFAAAATCETLRGWN